MWSSVLSNQRICDGQQFSNNGFPIFVEESESDTSLPIFIEPVVHSEDEGDKNSVLRVNSTLKSPSKIVPNDQAELNPSRTNATGSCSCENTTVALTLPTNGGKRFSPLQSSTPVKKQRKQQTINATEEHTIDATEEHERCTAGDLSVWKLSNVVNLNGCKEKCATTQHGLTEYDILSDHCGFDGKTQPEQNNWISQYFGTHCPSSSDGSKDIKNTLYIVRGKPVCLKVWLTVLSLSASRFYRLCQLFVEFGDTSNAVQLKRRRSLSTKTKDALAWMEHYFNKVGDKRPDKESILLPTCLTEKRIHEILIEQLYHGDTSKAICLSQFNKLFREEFKNVSIPKQCRFSKCDFCILLKLESSKPTTSIEERKKLEEILKDHVNLQDQERQRYRRNQLAGAEITGGCLSLIIDGMDQNKTNIPSLISVPKSCQNLWKLRTHLTGVVVHGLGHHCLFDYLQFPHDANLTLTAILFVLKEILNSRRLPCKLFIQMDNCVRENKNKYVYGFMAYLVEKNIFKEIELGFLMVGHTHEDVDQRFSRLSQYLSKNSASTIAAMLESAKRSNPDVVHASVVEEVYNIREWIAPHLEEIHYHTEPHIFMFKKDGSGKAVMQYKFWSHNDWIGNCVLLKSVPTGRPELIQPSLAKQDLGQLKKDIVKYEIAGAIKSDDLVQWKEDISGIENRFGSTPQSSGWILDSITMVDERFTASSTIDVPVNPRIQNYASKYTNHRPIQIGKKKPARKGPDTIPTEPESIAPSPYEVGDYVYLKCQRYKEFLPQVGKVASIGTTVIKVGWLEGDYDEKFKFWRGRRNKIVTEEFPKRAVVGKISLSPSMELSSEDIIMMKENYVTAEFV